MTATRNAIPTDGKAGSNTMVVDLDVHEAIYSFEDDILPRLAPQWRRFVTEYAWSGGGPPIRDAMPYPFPNAGYRETWLHDAQQATGDKGLELLRQHLFDEEQVTIAVLNGFFHVSGMEGGYEFASAVGAAYNDYQLEHWLDADARLRGSVHVVAHLPDLAAQEIDRVAAHPQIVQVFLPTVTDRQYGDPYYHPIFEAAVRNHLVLSLHHGTHTRCAQFGFPRYWVEWHALAPPLAAQIQLTSMIFNGVFDKFPALKVIVLETGVGWLPWFMDRLDDHYRAARADTPWVKRLPSEIIKESVRFTTQPMSPIASRELTKIAEDCQSDRLFVFATDYPHWDADDPQSVVRGLAPELRDRVLWRNAVETIPRLGKAA